MTAQTAWMANGDTDDDSTAVAAGLAAAGLAVAPFLGLPAMPTAHLSTEHTLRASACACCAAAPRGRRVRCLGGLIRIRLYT